LVDSAAGKKLRALPLRWLLAANLVALSLSACDDSEKRLVELSNQGVEALESDDFARAADLFQKAAKLRPNDADVQYYLGVIALHNEDANRALQHLALSAKADPRRPDVHLSLARALFASKRPEEALPPLRALFAIDPGHPNGHLLEARIALGAEDRETADKALRAAIAGDAGFAPAYLMLSHLYSDVGAFDAARDVLQEGLRFQPDAVELQEALGLAWLDLGRPDRAKVILAKACKHPRAKYAVNLNYAAALLQLGEKEDAMQALRTFILQSQGQGPDPAVPVAAKMLLKLRGR